jgi:ornithine cyclodeaminase/alanine dehydrogenase-like protein (mu-crystallin family)
MPELAILDHDTVLAAVSPAGAITATREAFLEHHRGAWTMPPKVYVENYPAGDFRAMPAMGGGFAMVKWITSFPGNPAKGLPTVSGVLVLSDADTGVPLAILDARAVTALRTGAVAAVAAQALARDEARTVGIVGCGLHGTWAARCMVAAGYGPGVCADPDAAAAARLARELGWDAEGDPFACDIVCCVTPGHEVVLTEDRLRAGVHLNMLGADGPGKAEATIEAVRACRLFCDEWAQASHGGELTGAVEAGVVTRADVTDLGAVLAGDAPGRRDRATSTLFDSTGLAIQDLGVAAAALDAVRAGRVPARTVSL